MAPLASGLERALPGPLLAHELLDEVLSRSTSLPCSGAGNGIEPATLSLGNGPLGDPAVSSGSQGVGNPGGGRERGVQQSQPVQEIFRLLATPLLPAAGERTGQQAERMLTVREAAQALRVSTATVYKLCASGKLPHVRALNVIRLPKRAVDALRRS
jgi:excisionase family DNA binding protein